MDTSAFNFAALLAPFDEQCFRDEYYGRKVLHVPRASLSGRGFDKAGLMSPARLSELLAEPARWAESAIKLVINGRGVDPAHYTVSREFAKGAGTRPDPALVETLMAVGASLVIDGLEDQSHALRHMCRVLGEQFGAKATVNLYASRRGVQAFSSHCDPHEVFAVHCEGEKVWRIYENAEDAPVEATLVRDADHIARAKGQVAMEITMRPGDLLYIPRGRYHDALASSETSLHLTFGVQPLYGVAVLDLLREIALEDRTMREYLPPAREGEALRRQLGAIAARLGAMVDTPGMLEDIAVRQRTLASPVPAPQSAASSEVFVRTQLPCGVEQPLTGSVLTIGTQRLPAGLVSDAARWAFAQASFTWPQFAARFCHHPPAELEAFLATAIAQGAFESRPMA
ncbi:MAG: cupin domain-containing protein [Erythrobacter sp.]|uniref:JmjC domain-containing protein n=1 Tax=Erythrobacter sp. TaxID=1042 RepID=UPI0025D36722|nr:cupin domain-containing protein [Erythrobacter sp.]MCL9999287.1 cupin domain-containing protein [Erythrobacter sp.]